MNLNREPHPASEGQGTQGFSIFFCSVCCSFVFFTKPKGTGPSVGFLEAGNQQGDTKRFDSRVTVALLRRQRIASLSRKSIAELDAAAVPRYLAPQVLPAEEEQSKLL
jgi:hypothetical protein